MKIEHIVDEETKQKLNYKPTNQVKKKRRKKHKEKLSERDIKELMGIHRDTYTRRNGAIRRK